MLRKTDQPGRIEFMDSSKHRRSAIPKLLPRPESSGAGPLSLRAETTCVGFLLLFHCVICLSTIFSESITHDEIWHLPVGLRNLREGRFDIERVNPPLSRMWAAIPLALGQVHIDPETTGQPVGLKFVLDHQSDFATWYHWGRCYHLFWTLASALIVYLWGRRIYGQAVSLFCLLLYLTGPNLIAHASVVTPDLAGVFGYLSTLYCLACWCDRPTWGRGVLLGFLLGLAQGLKFTCLLLYPLVIVIACLRLWRRQSGPAVSLKFLSLQLLVACSVSLPVLWLCYGFQGVFQPLAKFHFQSIDLISLQNFFAAIPALPVPVPADYILGIDEQRFVMAAEHPVFLDGQWALNGFRSYFLMALLYKLPHFPQLLILSAMIIFSFNKNARKRWRDVVTLLTPVIAILLVASGERLQLGLRYILPVIPLLILFCGLTFETLLRSSFLTCRDISVLTITFCLLPLRFHPGHLAYFNEWAGGPSGGREHLVDSNLDWGQDLGHLRDYMQQKKITYLKLAYFGTVPPRVMGINYDLPPRTPEPGRYAVSVNFVMGRPHGITLEDGSTRAADFQEFGYFRFFQPVKTLGGSIDLYEISEQDTADWDRALQEIQTVNP